MILSRAKSELLVIFDCNFALSVIKGGQPDQTFEFLAACGSDDITNMPGDLSFTSALIWALKRLGRSKSRFSTHQLLQMINYEAPGFPADQQASLIERTGTESYVFRKLVLAPLSKPEEQDLESSIGSRKSPLPKEQVDSPTDSDDGLFAVPIGSTLKNTSFDPPPKTRRYIPGGPDGGGRYVDEDGTEIPVEGTPSGKSEEDDSDNDSKDGLFAVPITPRAQGTAPDRPEDRSRSRKVRRLDSILKG